MHLSPCTSGGGAEGRAYGRKEASGRNGNTLRDCAKALQRASHSGNAGCRRMPSEYEGRQTTHGQRRGHGCGDLTLCHAPCLRPPLLAARCQAASRGRAVKTDGLPVQAVPARMGGPLRCGRPFFSPTRTNYSVPGFEALAQHRKIGQSDRVAPSCWRR